MHVVLTVRSQDIAWRGGGTEIMTLKTLPSHDPCKNEICHFVFYSCISLQDLGGFDGRMSEVLGRLKSEGLFFQAPLVACGNITAFRFLS